MQNGWIPITEDTANTFIRGLQFEDFGPKKAQPLAHPSQQVISFLSKDSMKKDGDDSLNQLFISTKRDFARYEFLLHIHKKHMSSELFRRFVTDALLHGA